MLGLLPKSKGIVYEEFWYIWWSAKSKVKSYISSQKYTRVITKITTWLDHIWNFFFWHEKTEKIEYKYIVSIQFSAKFSCVLEIVCVRK